jgi:hypothetical protein
VTILVGMHAAVDIGIGKCHAESALPFAAEVWCVHTSQVSGQDSDGRSSYELLSGCVVAGSTGLPGD